MLSKIPLTLLYREGLAFYNKLALFIFLNEQGLELLNHLLLLQPTPLHRPHTLLMLRAQLLLPLLPPLLPKIQASPLSPLC